MMNSKTGVMLSHC